MKTLGPGDGAPAFALSDQRGGTVRLDGFRGRKLLVYFYPEADTPGCTTQSCDVRDHRTDLAGIGVDVVGVSPDAPAAQLAFDRKYGLGFPLLADENHKVAQTWGTWGKKTLYGRSFMGIIRSAFVVDEKGKLADVFYKVSPKATVPKVTEALEG